MTIPASISILLLLGRMRHPDAVLALLGGLLCFFCDGVHVHTGTLSYTFPVVGAPVPQAWFVFPLFVFAAGKHTEGVFAGKHCPPIRRPPKVFLFKMYTYTFHG